MDSPSFIDTTYNVRTDAGGKDPDSHSKTLRRYHQVLWSKPLPNGAAFELDAKLHHQSELGEFWLSSDAITHTYSKGQPDRIAEVVRQIPAPEVEAFYDLGCTVGAYLVFPYQVQVDGQWKRSINQARGMHPRIRDRFDLTLECIRRYYLGAESPLSAALGWYADFFALFQDFPGYVEHFLLNDLVTDDYGSVRFWKDFDDFTGDPLPAASVAEYREYMRRSMDFITRRNERIANYSKSLPQDPMLGAHAAIPTPSETGGHPNG